MINEMRIIENAFTAHQELIIKLKDTYFEEIYNFSTNVANGLAEGATIFFCGNGGSASDSEHLASELIGRFKGERKALRAVSLVSDSAVTTSIANDFSYEDIFSRQLEGLARPNDYLIVLSTSGESENVLKALRTAKKMSLNTISLLGKEGGRAKSLSDQSFVVPSFETDRIQEMHILIGHIMCEIVECELGLVK